MVRQAMASGERAYESDEQHEVQRSGEQGVGLEYTGPGAAGR
jgi:hypothetical protein